MKAEILIEEIIENDVIDSLRDRAKQLEEDIEVLSKEIQKEVDAHGSGLDEHRVSWLRSFTEGTRRRISALNRLADVLEASCDPGL